MQRNIIFNPFYDELIYDATGLEVDELRGIVDHALDAMLVSQMTEETAKRFFHEGDEMNNGAPSAASELARSNNDPLFLAKCECGWPGKNGPQQVWAIDLMEAAQSAHLRHDGDLSQYIKRVRLEFRSRCRMHIWYTH